MFSSLIIPFYHKRVLSLTLGIVLKFHRFVVSTDLKTALIPHNSRIAVVPYRTTFLIKPYLSLYRTNRSCTVPHFNFAPISLNSVIFVAYQERNLTQAFVFKASSTNPNLIVVSFRGTDPFDADDWCTDLDVSWYEMKKVGKIHAGFSRALGLQKNGWPKENISLIHQYAYYTIRQKLRDMLAIDKNSKFILTGHSIGGAIAALFPGPAQLHIWPLDKFNIYAI
ncbi:unnamed protein product [Brassica oleracea var. botrytis]